MKTVIKNVLLGSVAGLAMVGTAAAADLPVKAKAAEYVKICSTYGAGFYYIPGTDTCLKVGGYVTADTYWTDVDVKDRFNGAQVTDRIDPDGQFDFTTRAAIQLDARTQTEYGTLRSYIEARFEAGESFGFGQNEDGTAGGFDDVGGSDAYLKYGYIQFAGFTFGRAQSMFDFWAGDFWYGIRPGNFYSDTTTQLVAYTADFGNGFSATISLEDAYSRDGDFGGFPGNFFLPDFDLVDGQQVPDVVANIAYEGTWGAFKVSGAYHDIGDVLFTGLPISNSDSSGWAALAGVRFDFAETTTLYIEGVYADGAPGYLGLKGTIPTVDAMGNTVSGWYVGGALQHYWTPSVFTSVVGSWTETDDFSVLDAFASTKFEGYNVGANIGWIPVKGLTLVLQYDYLSAEYKGTDTFFLPPDTFSQETTQNRITFSARRSF